MPNLHVHYHNGNIKLFRQELDGTANNNNTNNNGGGGKIGPGSASGGKSWSMSGLSGVPVKADINERDSLGRTVLHLAASSLTPMSYTFLSILLRNPNISVNLQDQESGYTALHRALFAGNIRAARDLLARNDIDTSIKDIEGMTAYDLYNGTVEGTNPPHDVDGTDLYVWGVNRNFALGTGDSSDKAYPDHINLLTQAQANGRSDPSERFDHVGVKDVVMAKLHTGVITNETRGNLSICGFGANGRLGRSVHSQLSLLPMPDMPHKIIAIALGQDHTLALASGGYILSWGHNRFSQLGYVVEPPEKPMTNSRDDDLVQVSPKRIVGPLKKEMVRGVAASRMASACWTDDAVWTWGTNAGHLGYDKASNPVQIAPRRVTSITQPVIDIAFSEYAMICLLDSFEVLCFHRDTNFKISFSTPRVLSEAFPFRPPQATLKPMIKKVTSCGTSFAALSSIGDVFTFSLPNPLEDVSKEGRDRHVTVKPQMIWALRKSFTAVKDVALGTDGTVIICTHSGHVFVRQRLKSGSGQLKFRRIPYLQRVIKVAVNESGAFAAIRVDADPTRISLTGRTLQEDMFLLQPHFRRFEHQMTAEDFDREHSKQKADEDEEDESTNSVAKDTSIALRMCTILSRWRTEEGDSLFAWSDSLLGSDIHLVVKGLAIPAHSVIISLRIPKLADLLAGRYKSDRLTFGKYGPSKAVYIKACHPLVALLLLHYIYSDEVTAIYDSRVARLVQEKFGSMKIPIGDIKSDLKDIADELDLAPLSSVLSYAAKQPLSQQTLPHDFQAFFTKTSIVPATIKSATDVTLVLADKEVSCNSTILRARCPFFEAMFADSDWTLGRKDEGRVVVKMKHLKWTPMRLVFRYIHEGVEDDLFDYLHQETLDDFLDFVFEVLAAATELLLDRLVLVCSRVIIRHCNVFNAAALATEAAFYQATTLKLSIFDYIISCLETMLESGLLDEMEHDVLQDLCETIAQKQGAKLSVSRSQFLVKQAMEKHRDWLLLQDIPVPRVRQPFRWKPRSPALSPVETMTPVREKRRPRPLPSPTASPEIQPQPDRSSSAADGMFQMDDDFPTPSSGAQTPRAARPMTPLDLSASAKPQTWRSKTVETEKVDLRSIMAEAAGSRTPARGPQIPGSVPRGSSSTIPMTTSTPTKSPAISTARSPPSTSSASGGPSWRPLEVRKTSLSSVQAQQTSTLNRPAGSQASPVPVRTGSSRIITPVKLATPPIASRKISGPVPSNNAAWATPTTFAPSPAPPILATSPTTAATQSFSLLAIQQEERDIAEMSTKKPAKSLIQIQEEEREAEKARIQEQEFMRWWQEEEARLAKEENPSRSNGMTKGGRGGGGGGKMRIPNTKGKQGAGGGGKVVGGTGGGSGAKDGAPKSKINSATGEAVPSPKPKTKQPNGKATTGKSGGGSAEGSDKTNGPALATTTPRKADAVRGKPLSASPASAAPSGTAAQPSTTMRISAPVFVPGGGGGGGR
ncbi:hypothetical protein CI109_100501 [Kwoniella shandongensis]|uniref:Uncharacterized protein n=1 Tax=Kwoniella shandongensis TaxID=1734106 RepID=A0A5M6C3L0_9TREE|nr:uncharacterized protein CI109_001656 [Kwoniella shandongensis]KAA5529717.1 hypothetical protein CI109_001656 [Kwoniella shandongensis]